MLAEDVSVYMCEVRANALDLGGRPWKSLDVYGWLPGPDSNCIAGS